MSSRQAETIYRIPRRTLLNKVKNKHSGSVRHPTMLTEVEERCLVDVVIASAEFGAPMTDLDVRMLVKNNLDEKGVEMPVFKNNLPGTEWVSLFLKRHKDKLSKRHCQNLKRNRAGKTSDEFQEYFDNLKITLTDVSPNNILNYDETNLSDNPGKRS